MNCIHKHRRCTAHTGIGRCQTFMIYLYRKRRPTRTHGFPDEIFPALNKHCFDADFPKWFMKCLKLSRALH